MSLEIAQKVIVPQKNDKIEGLKDEALKQTGQTLL